MRAWGLQRRALFCLSRGEASLLLCSRAEGHGGRERQEMFRAWLRETGGIQSVARERGQYPLRVVREDGADPDVGESASYGDVPRGRAGGEVREDDAARTGSTIVRDPRLRPKARPHLRPRLAA